MRSIIGIVSPVDYARPAPPALTVVEALHPEFGVNLEKTDLDKCGLGRLLNVERSAETKRAGIQYAVLFHFAKPLARR